MTKLSYFFILSSALRNTLDDEEKSLENENINAVIRESSQLIRKLKHADTQ